MTTMTTCRCQSFSGASLPIWISFNIWYSSQQKKPTKISKGGSVIPRQERRPEKNCSKSSRNCACISLRSPSLNSVCGTDREGVPQIIAGAVTLSYRNKLCGKAHIARCCSRNFRVSVSRDIHRLFVGRNPGITDSIHGIFATAAGQNRHTANFGDITSGRAALSAEMR